MSKVKSITDLRNEALDTLEGLRNGTIEMAHAAVVAKVCDAVINTIRMQVDYAKTTSTPLQIDFMNDDKAPLEITDQRDLNIMSRKIPKKLIDI